MEIFENLKNDWQNQSHQIPSDKEFKMVKNKIKAVKSKQRIMNVILLATVSILVFFFFYVSAYTQSRMIWGLTLMIVPLLVRVTIELFSIRKLNKVNRGIASKAFKDILRKYYKLRKQIHFVVTPILVGLYIYGFTMLLPFFKKELSTGFYNYIVVSSVVILIVLSIFIIKEIRKELLFLSEIKLN
ncbi:hypothetical protein GGR42_001998 [Saonia flava]|uniref:Uncharacterized protein n=1 Tax=Saonia flava TaxID=523696 RepID=A0A846QR91_9FLAO|nr:hypothetical protein [Saonia flava]NJB71536.1 hypothetical protein [Saonia flava]